MKAFKKSMILAVMASAMTASFAFAEPKTGEMDAKGGGKSVNCPSLASNSDKGGGQQVDSADPKASPAPTGAAAGQGK